ncbi:hypothetical protein BB561_004427 [Smittium simulii]|uniref:Uncharacterized protein n=1 Tax=Smittium simulii TaxID=133385 RepID=A0A2T9YG77_9FUNG|nr:hypothetical protein BB561_004427 [Smittium simulii]
MDILFNDSDIDYKNTKLISSIPPPDYYAIDDLAHQTSRKNISTPSRRINTDAADDFHESRRPSKISHFSTLRNNIPSLSENINTDDDLIKSRRHSEASQSSALPFPKNKESTILPPICNISLCSFSRFPEPNIHQNLEQLFSAIKVKPFHLKNVHIDNTLFPDGLHTRIVRLKDRMNNAPKSELISAKNKADPFAALKSINLNADAIYFAWLESQTQVIKNLLHKKKTPTITELYISSYSGFTDYIKLYSENDTSSSDISCNFIFKNITKSKNTTSSQNPCSLFNILADKQNLPVTNDFWETELLKFDFNSHLLVNTNFVDLIIGKFTLPDSQDEITNEIYTYKYLFKTLIFTLTTLENNGHVILYVSGSNTRLSSQIISILSFIFTSINIQKPPSSDQTKYDRFLFCKNLTLTHETRSNLLDLILSSFPNDFFSDCDNYFEILSTDFSSRDHKLIKFLYSINLSIGLGNQKYLEELLKCLDERNAPTVYDHKKIAEACKTSWKLP